MKDICGIVDFSRNLCLVSYDLSAILAHASSGSSINDLSGAYPPTENFVSPARDDSRDSGLAIVADCELYNRSELLGRLSRTDLSVSSSDAALILAAYERWGDTCPEFLQGDFAFAIRDWTRRRLFCCRDHFGKRPFYYWTDDARFVFSSDSLALLRFPGIETRLNRQRLLACSLPGGFGVLPEETLHRGIFSLPAATTLVYTRSGLAKRRFWEPGQQQPFIPAAENEAFEALQSLLTDAVDRRLQGKTRVAAFLSGGLDSSAVVGIAARLLEKRGVGIRAIAAVLPESSRSRFEDEREYIEEFRSWPNVEIDYVAPPDGGPFDNIDNASFFAHNPMVASSSYLTRALEAAAATHGAETILVGNWGEIGPTTTGAGYFLELAAGLRWVLLTRELSLLKQTVGISPFRMLGREILDHLWPYRNAGSSVLLASGFVLAAEALRQRSGFHWPDHRVVQANLIRLPLTAHALRRPRTAAQIPSSTPFLDTRVVEFCLAAPGRMKVRDGYPRYLVRKALDGILPPKIQWRTGKCPFAPDYMLRYEKQLGKAREFVASLGRKDPVRAVVDVDRLQYLVDRWDTPAGRNAAFVVVPNTIYMICFLRQFPEFQS